MKEIIRLEVGKFSESHENASTKINFKKILKEDIETNIVLTNGAHFYLRLINSC